MTIIYSVEDDASIRELILYAAKTCGYQAQGFENAQSMYQALEQVIPSVILLDIMLPGKDGITVLKELKASEKYKHIPVILLTAKSAEYDKVHGLDLGADDYISKPFGVMEMLSRIRAVLRRTQVDPSTVQIPPPLEFKDIVLDVNKRTATINNQPCSLTFKEFDLLSYFIKNRGIVLSRDKIMSVVWGYDYAGESRTIDMHVKTLRQKLQDNNSQVVIRTVRSVGYVLEE